MKASSTPLRATYLYVWMSSTSCTQHTVGLLFIHSGLFIGLLICSHWMLLDLCLLFYVFQCLLFLYSLFLLFFALIVSSVTFLKKILFTEREREGERGRETSMCGCLSHTPHWGPGPHPRQVPWPGNEPATLWFEGRRSSHWATPARALV